MDRKKYIKVPAIYKKFQLSEEMGVPIYISGSVGYGKTAAMEYYYRKQAHLVLSGEPGFFSSMPKLSDIKQRVIVFDDISWITDEVSRNYIIEVIRNRKLFDKQIVLIGRSPLPSWLRELSVLENFVTAGEQDLMFGGIETKKFLESRGILALPEEISQINKDSYGYPIALEFLIYQLKNKMSVNIEFAEEKEGCGYDSAMVSQVMLDMFHYYDKALYEKWDIQMREMLLDMCQYPKFTVPMVEMITTCRNVPKILEEAMAIGTFLTKIDEETYTCRTHLQQYLCWKQSVVYSSEMIKENFNRGAHYYEITNQIELALEYYTKAGNEERIVELLISNARKQPGTAHFFETRKFYFALPEATICKHPALMCGMSMLHSLILQPEQSKYWYDRLVEFEHNASHGSQERKEATVRVAYLDIALPQKGVRGLMKKLQSAALLAMNQKIALPEFAVTGNIPSIINGGLDFCEWCRNDKELGIILKKPLEIVLGKYGVGLVNIALAESGLEKGTMDSYEIMTRLNNGFHVSDVGGKIEMNFVAAGLIIKEHMLQGQPMQAESIYDTFYQKVIEEKATHLLPNLQTLHMWMHLIQGDTKEAEHWLETAPNDMLAFCILDRYQHIHKIRVLTSLDRKEEALALVERMNIYFTGYERNYLWMENQILKAILLYRMGNESWQEVFYQVLKKAFHYHFITIFALEGAGLKPLLDVIKLPESTICPESFFYSIKNANEKMAAYYPNYMKIQNALEEPLTESEDRILKLMCRGLTSKEICEMCHITYNGFKFHAHNIYRKMKVKNRGEAEREAIRLGIDR
ncbi:MAG: LuxR C-terminal-related transcriptional regulator [Lachnospiraceae bacterium]